MQVKMTNLQGTACDVCLWWHRMHVRRHHLKRLKAFRLLVITRQPSGDGSVVLSPLTAVLRYLRRYQHAALRCSISASLR